MTRRFATFATGLVLASAVTAFAERRTSAAPMYTITGISPLSGTSQTIPTAINNNGQVVGVSYNTMTGNATTYAANYGEGAKYFLSSGGQTSQITGTGEVPTDINDLGQIVGGAQSINNQGKIQSGTNIVSPDGSVKETLYYHLDNGPALAIPMDKVYRINNSGLVAGNGWGGAMVYVPAGANWAEASLFDHGNTYKGLYGGIFISLGSASRGDAVDINDRGEVLMQDKYNAMTYILDQTGHLVSLKDLPGGAHMLGVAINDSGQVVGSQVSIDHNGSLVNPSDYNYLEAALYTKGQIIDLNSVIAAGSGWDLTRATGINDLGQIIGQGTYDGQVMGFVLTPTGQEVPEPGTLAFATLAILALGGRAMAQHAI